MPPSPISPSPGGGTWPATGEGQTCRSNIPSPSQSQTQIKQRAHTPVVSVKPAWHVFASAVLVKVKGSNPRTPLAAILSPRADQPYTPIHTRQHTYTPPYNTQHTHGRGMWSPLRPERKPSEDRRQGQAGEEVWLYRRCEDSAARANSWKHHTHVRGRFSNSAADLNHLARQITLLLDTPVNEPPPYFPAPPTPAPAATMALPNTASVPAGLHRSQTCCCCCCCCCWLLV